MAKDPATLWYWNDWHSGTILFSRFLKGCYMDLLHAQFNNGRLSLEEIKTCLGSDFGQSWPTLQKKFKQDETGLFFNERAEQEKQKRAAYSESRRKNRTEKTHDLSYDKHMKPHMENRNRNENIDEVKDFGKCENLLYPIEECLMIALRDSRFVKSNKTNDYELHRFNEYLEQQGKYSINPLDYKTYFAKLKGKYPAMLKKETTVEELREIAKKMDQYGIASSV